MSGRGGDRGGGKIGEKELFIPLLNFTVKGERR
jgi:hypothetical protein